MEFNRRFWFKNEKDFILGFFLLFLKMFNLAQTEFVLLVLILIYTGKYFEEQTSINKRRDQKSYQLLRNEIQTLRFLTQDTNIILCKIKRNIGAFSEFSCKKVSSGNSRKTNCNQRVKKVTQTACQPMTNHQEVQKVRSKQRKVRNNKLNRNVVKNISIEQNPSKNWSEINSYGFDIYKFSEILPGQIKRFYKVCFENNCPNVMTSNLPIETNLCPDCKPPNGKRIDFFQFLTKANGRLQFFCGCQLCQKGETSQCLENYCPLCTCPKYVEKQK